MMKLSTEYTYMWSIQWSLPEMWELLIMMIIPHEKKMESNVYSDLEDPINLAKGVEACYIDH